MKKVLHCQSNGCNYITVHKCDFQRHKNKHKLNLKPKIHSQSSCPINNCRWKGLNSNLSRHLKNKHQQCRSLKQLRSKSEDKTQLSFIPSLLFPIFKQQQVFGKNKIQLLMLRAPKNINRSRDNDQISNDSDVADGIKKNKQSLFQGLKDCTQLQTKSIKSNK